MTIICQACIHSPTGDCGQHGTFTMSNAPSWQSGHMDASGFRDDTEELAELRDALEHLREMFVALGTQAIPGLRAAFLAGYSAMRAQTNLGDFGEEAWEASDIKRVMSPEPLTGAELKRAHGLAIQIGWLPDPNDGT